MSASDVIRVSDQSYILATSSRVDDRTRVLKHGDTFAVFDRLGDIEPVGLRAFGLYHQDTRYLSRLALRLGTDRPLLLSSMVKHDNGLLTVDLTNQDIRIDGEHLIPRGTVHLYRAKILWEATCYDSVRIHNYGSAAVDLSLVFHFDVDFADLFEVRGMERSRRGARHEPVIGQDTVEFGYEGLDDRPRATVLVFDPPPVELDATHARFDVRLAPRAEAVCRVAIRCRPGGTAPTPDGGNGGSGGARALLVPSYDEAAERSAAALDAARASEPRIVTSSPRFNEWLDRSAADLHLMKTETPWGAYPYAGIPWFSTAFGRDGIITALENLWINPGFARGVLSFLAATQADADDAVRDAQPGKILHEIRQGEMANLGEVPFGRYYGSVDVTPLFVMLAGAYYERTGDIGFAESLWPHVERALGWMDRAGDADGDGFVEYARRTRQGLVHQGWKDSHDAVFHEDGSDAVAPIALCEVQAYAYAARRGAAGLARTLGYTPLATVLLEQATQLRRRYEATFWLDEMNTYALALDGEKRLCRVRTSNAGHGLYTGIVSADRAARLARTLMDDASFSGWGVRTVASTESRYNPMSYHNGSVWPHDNAILAAGLARYGSQDAAARIFTGMFEASQSFDLHRMPELFCGFHRRPDEIPTAYPVSCAPQSWAAAAVFLLLQACLGIEVSAVRRRLTFCQPFLPPFLREVEIRELRVREARLDIALVRHERDVALHVLDRDGPLEIVVMK